MKDKRLLIRIIAIPLILVLGMAVLFITLSHQEMKYNIEHYYRFMELSAKEHNRDIAISLDEPFVLLETFASSDLFTRNNTLNIMAITTRMGELARTSSIDKFFYIGKDGRKISRSGQNSNYHSELSDKLLSTNGRLVLNATDYSTFDKGYLLLSVPVHRNEQMIGVLVGEYALNNFEELTESHGLYMDGLHCLVDSTGDILISVYNGTRNNLLLALKGETMENAAASMRMEEALKNRTPEKYDIEWDDRDYYFYSAPTELEKYGIYDWTIVEAVSKKALAEDTSIMKTYVITVFLITIGVAMFLVMLLRRGSKDSYELAYRVQHDMLTGLYNSSLLESRVNEHMISAAENPQSAFFIIDIDGMSSINDKLGHNMGDEAIKAVAKVLDKQFRESDVVARMNGGEFAVLLKKVDSKAMLESIARRMIDAVASITYGEGANRVSVSVGIAVGVAGDTLDTLYHRASKALRTTKLMTKGGFTFEHTEE